MFDTATLLATSASRRIRASLGIAGPCIDMHSTSARRNEDYPGVTASTPPTLPEEYHRLIDEWEALHVSHAIDADTHGEGI
jgi:hypothetical protein